MADRVLEKLKYSSTISLPGGDGYTPQSLAFISNSNRKVICSGASPNIVLQVTDKSYNSLGRKISTGHANGGTYCSKNNLIYTTAYSGSSNTKKIVATNCSNLNHEFSVTLPTSATGIAYDRVTNQFYVSSGKKIYIYPFEALAKGGTYKGDYTSFTKNWTNDGRDNQDIGGHNGVVLVCRSYEKSKKGKIQRGFIDCYDAGNGNYIKSFYSDYGELESVAVDNSNHMHIIFAQDRKIVVTSNLFDLVGSGANGVASDSESTLGLQVSPDKLYRSDNYVFIGETSDENDPVSEFRKNLKDVIASWSSDGFKPIPDTTHTNLVLTSASGQLDRTKLRRTKISGEVFGPNLPIALNPVEAPFMELTIGDYTFGVFEASNRYDKYPNYIDSMSVVRTNGSMNEYTINLIHQVRPGSNPNFIDELISKNGYDKITIRYGDANSGVEFIDTNALLIGVNNSFDFTNCNIKYTLRATSSAISIASHKRTFASVQDKPSNIIRDLLYNDANEDLLQAFPAMRDKNFVELNNLIPTNDMVVSIEEFKNINVVSYLKNLVSFMKSTTDSIVKSTYMLTIEDGYFNINQITNNYIYDSSLYEVDINFPDDNQVFDFSIDTNYSWPIAYAYSGGVSNYTYDIGNNGNIHHFSSLSSNLLDFSSQMQENVNSNWWTQVTEFPISAKLTCRGLLSPLLLLTYIKINCIYYGSERLTSGVYIVTGQTDTLSGSGYKTTLSLLRVAGKQQHLTIDGRVRT